MLVKTQAKFKFETLEKAKRFKATISDLVPEVTIIDGRSVPGTDGKDMYLCTLVSNDIAEVDVYYIDKTGIKVTTKVSDTIEIERFLDLDDIMNIVNQE